MDNSKYIERLEKRGIKPTANRILVLEAMLAASRAVSLGELEGMLGTVDRSSIFRTLGHFLQNRLIHDIEDGSGSVKYEVCDSDSACSVADMHAHFFCEVCHRTFCLKKVQIPVTTLPEGFVMHSVNYTVKGVCEQCSKARRHAPAPEAFPPPVPEPDRSHLPSPQPTDLQPGCREERLSLPGKKDKQPINNP